MEFFKPFATPLVWVLLLLVAGLWRTRWAGTNRRHRVGWWLALVGTVLLWTLSLRPVAGLLTHSLARGYPPATDEMLNTLDLVVVLGGGMSGWDRPSVPVELNGHAQLRWFHGVRAFKIGGAPVLAFCGGVPRGAAISEAEVMKAMAVAMGVPAESILAETRSRNTMENATALAELLAPGRGRRIGLVTTETHMLRSERVFREVFADDTIVPVPVYYAYGAAQGLMQLVPSPRALDKSSRVIYEWIGLLWYTLQFRAGKGKKVQHGTPAGQGLTDLLHQKNVLGSGQDELPGPICPIYEPLDVGEQIRRPLGLVQDHGVLELSQEPSGVFRRESSMIGIFQRDVPKVWKDSSDQRGLPRLAGTGEQHDGVLFGRGAQFLLKMALDHERVLFYVFLQV